MSWKKSNILTPIPAAVGSVASALSSVTSTLSSLFSAITILLEIAKVFIQGTLEPFQAIVNSIISELQTLINDIFGTGFYILIVNPFEVNRSSELQKINESRQSLLEQWTIAEQQFKEEEKELEKRRANANPRQVAEIDSKLESLEQKRIDKKASLDNQREMLEYERANYNFDSFGIPILTPGNAISIAIDSFDDLGDPERPEFGDTGATIKAKAIIPLFGVAVSSGTYEGVKFFAETPGQLGNNITLVFDGVKTIQQVMNSWNSSNSYNKVRTTSVLTTSVLNAGSLTLTGGQVDSTVVLEAFESGAKGNNITLVFDGNKNIAEVISDWNSANLTNQVKKISGNLGSVISAQTIKLVGGVDILPGASTVAGIGLMLTSPTLDQFKVLLENFLKVFEIPEFSTILYRINEISKTDTPKSEIPNWNKYTLNSIEPLGKVQKTLIEALETVKGFQITADESIQDLIDIMKARSSQLDQLSNDLESIANSLNTATGIYSVGIKIGPGGVTRIKNELRDPLLECSTNKFTAMALIVGGGAGAADSVDALRGLLLGD